MPTKDKKANARISLAAGTPYKKVVKGGPSMSAKKMPERVKIAGKIKRKLSPAKMPNQPNFGTKSGFKKGLKEGAKALKDMFKSGKK